MFKSGLLMFAGAQDSVQLRNKKTSDKPKTETRQPIERTKTDAKFITCQACIAKINDKFYEITSDDPKTEPKLETLDPTKCSINVDGTHYPLRFKGFSLCNDLKYRRTLYDIGWSGPFSSFELEQPSPSPKI
jgi:hypothetical protein